MFEQRLKILLVLLAMPLLVLAARLVELQLVQAEDHRKAARDLLHQRPRFFPFLRGVIVDHQGIPLAYNAETWDIAVHYGVMTDDVSMRRTVFRSWNRTFDDALETEIERSWAIISELSGTPLEELHDTAARRVRRVQRIKRAVADYHGVSDMVVLEEWQAWPVARGLDHERQVEARLRLAAYPWVEIIPGQKRHYVGGPAIGPILGRMNEVPGDFDDDPFADDPLARYEPGDLWGASGAEALGEAWLRGRRGREHYDLEGRPLSEPVDPVNGHTMRLTIDLVLQTRIYERLAAAVAARPFSTGASAVLIHIPTGEVRAMVSYPSYDPNLPYDAWLALGDDTQMRPTLFRAVRQPYPPGSIVKPAILASAMASGDAPQTTVECFGRMFRDFEDRWRCLGHHGQVDLVTSIRQSCNIPYYQMGQRMGVPALAHWLAQFGLGQPTGTGLNEEHPGRLPRRGSLGDARLIGIGQGAFEATPLQAANIIATLASGVHQPARLWVDDPSPYRRTAPQIPEQAWRTVREGMYQAVNAPGGTAYGGSRATLDHPDLVLLGKTGSAQVPGAVIETQFTCAFPDGSVREIIAPTRRALLEAHPDARVVGHRAARRWPPEGHEQTHAWFAGYLAPRHRRTEPVRDGDMGYALAVVIEFAGHGGEVAAPVARDIFHDVLTRYRGRPASTATDGPILATARTPAAAEGGGRP